MSALAVTVLLGTAVLLASALAPRIRVPAPLVLVVTGLLLGLVPALREVELPPEAVLALFLPVILFWESLTTSLRAIRRDFRGIVILSTLLVVASAAGTAAIAHWAGLPWHAAFILGAALAPPDATAATALGRMLPQRQFMLLKAESLTNDGTALVLYAIAVGVATGDDYSTGEITGLLALSYLGGIAAGLAVAGAAYAVMKGLRDATTINVALLLTPFAAYLLAEEIGASGVLGVVSSGLVLSSMSGRVSNAASRRQTESAWPLGTLLLNGPLFVLIGLETLVVLRGLEPADVVRLAGISVATWLALLIIRFIFPQLAIVVIRLLDRRPSQRARRMSTRSRVVSAVAGFRGAVSLAIALSVPAVGADGSGVPARDDIVVVCAAVVVLTLLVQGPLLPVAIRWARFPDDDTTDGEVRLAETELAQAALDSIDDVAARHDIRQVVTEEVRRHYADHLEVVRARHGDDAAGQGADDPIVSPVDQTHERNRLALAMISHKRSALSTLRRRGTIDDVAARRLQSRLDVEELRLTGVEPVD